MKIANYVPPNFCAGDSKQEETTLWIQAFLSVRARLKSNEKTQTTDLSC